MKSYALRATPGRRAQAAASAAEVAAQQVDGGLEPQPLGVRKFVDERLELVAPRALELVGERAAAARQRDEALAGAGREAAVAQRDQRVASVGRRQPEPRGDRAHGVAAGPAIEQAQDAQVAQGQVVGRELGASRSASSARAARRGRGRGRGRDGRWSWAQSHRARMSGAEAIAESRLRVACSFADGVAGDVRANSR